MNNPKYGDKVTITEGQHKGKNGEVVSKFNYDICTVSTDIGPVIVHVSEVTEMNNQPKFKKGDRVRVTSFEGTAIIRAINGDFATVVLPNGMTDCFRMSQLEPIPSNTPDMLAIPDDHVWPETSDNEVVIVDELFEKQKESFIKAATSMTGSATLTPEFKALGEFSTKLDSVDQELEDVFKDLYKDTYHTAWDHLNNPIHPLHGAFLNFKAGAKWKAEQVANDAIGFISDTMGTSKESIINLYNIWQQNKKK